MSLVTLFQSSGFLSAIILALLVFLFFCLILISSKKDNVQPANCIHATYAYIMQMFGMILMSGGIIPTLYSILAPVTYSSVQYLCYLVLFTVGLLLHLRYASITKSMDYASKEVPFLLYSYTLRTIGMLLTVTSFLSLSLGAILQNQGSTWYVPFVGLVYGLGLLWVAHESNAIELQKTVSKKISTKKKITKKKSVKKKK